MPPTPMTLRLAQLDPTEVGREATRLALEHIGRLALPLGPGYEVRAEPPRAPLDDEEIAPVAGLLDQIRAAGFFVPRSAIRLARSGPPRERVASVETLTDGVVTFATQAAEAEAPIHDTDLGLTVAALCRYAQSGDTGDWGGPEGAEGAMLDVMAALYSAAGDPRGEGGSGPLDRLDEEADETGAVGLVLLAAYGRWRLWQGVAVSARELAALSGVSESQVRRVIAEQPSPLDLKTGEARHKRVTAKSATAWLESRGVPGFGRRARG